ncbi:MAG: CHAT domain-containing protein [Acidobacteria bacterium]|nr:CHAT domain-containing protein [Acidobacteriota bacterium]
MPERPPPDRLDADVIAAYLDGQLSSDEKAAVEAHLAADPETYAWVTNAMRVIDEMVASGSSTDSSSGVPDVNKAPRRTVVPMPPPPRPPFYRQRTVRAVMSGVLAAAAAVLLVVQIDPAWWRQLTGRDQIDPRFAKLVAAVGDERYIEGRLSGGFHYGPLRSATRGPGDLSNQNLALLAAAGELQKAAQADPSAENLHAWGVAQVLLGEYDEAIATFEVALAGTPGHAALLSDMGAAYAARARAGRSEDWPQAIETLNEAVEREPGHAEAWFNLAAALDEMRLTREAARAWEQYLTLDSSSPWAAHARQRLAAPTGGPVSSLPTPGSPACTDQHTAWREFDAGLRAWATATTAAAEQTGEAQATLQRHATCVSESGDRWATETLQALEHVGGHAADVARSLTKMLDSEALRGEARFAEAARLAEDVYPRLGDEHPVALRAAQAAIAYQFSVGRMNDAEQTAREILAVARRRNYLRVAAEMLGNLGATAYSRGDYEGSIARHQEALALWQRLALPGGASMTATRTAEGHRALGDFDGAWRHLHGALQTRQSIDDRSQRHVGLVSPAVGALNQGLPRVAGYFAREAQAEARRGAQRGFVCEAGIFSARAAWMTSSPLAPLDLLRDVSADCDAVSDVGLRQRLLAEYHLTAATLAAETNPAVSLAEAEQSLELYRAAATGQRVVDLHRLRSMAFRNLGDPVRSLEASQQGVALVASTRGQLGSLDRRRTYTDRFWDVYGEQINTVVATGELDRAVQLADAGAALGFSGHHGVAPLGRDLVASIPARTLLLIPVVTEAQVVVLAATQQRLRHVVVPVHRRELRRWATELTMLLARRASLSQIDAAGDRLAATIVGPFERELDDVDTVLLVQDPVLQSVPLAMLRLQRGGVYSRLVSRFAIVNCITVRACVTGEPPAAPVKIDAAYLIQPSGRGREPALPGARAEVALIREVYPHSEVSDAVDNVMRRALASSAVVHYAGHAFVDVSDPERSALYLAPDERGEPRRLAIGRILPPVIAAPVVVLSACQTMFGRSYRGDGMVGLARILLERGARNVLGTLWPVRDDEVAAVMLDFHKGLASGMTAHAALAAAQRSVERVKPHPSSWAFAAVTTRAAG